MATRQVYRAKSRKTSQSKGPRAEWEEVSADEVKEQVEALVRGGERALREKLPVKKGSHGQACDQK